MNQLHKEILTSVGPNIRINKRPDGKFSITGANNQDTKIKSGPFEGKSTYDFPFDKKEDIHAIANEAVSSGIFSETTIVTSAPDNT